MKLDRRTFLFGLGATALAIPTINLRQTPFLWGDGKHDDTDAINALIRGERVETSAGIFHDTNGLSGGEYLISAPIRIARSSFALNDMKIIGATGFVGKNLIHVEPADPTSMLRDVSIGQMEVWPSEGDYRAHKARLEGRPYVSRFEMASDSPSTFIHLN